MTFEEYRNAVLETLGSSNVVNVRYFVNYRKAVLDMLDVEYETEDLRNEVKFRLKVLEGLVKGGGLPVDDANVRYFADYRKAVLDTLCVDYTIEDLRNEDRFREKVLGELSFYGGSLPDGYKRVKYMTMNNDCYYEITDFYLKGSDTLKFSFSIKSTCNVIGSYSGSSSGANYSLYASVSNVSYLRYYSGTYNSMFEADKRYDVVITPTGTKGFKYNSTWDELEFTTTKPMCIGTTRANLTTSAKMKGTFFGNIIVKDANGIRFKGIPCIREADDVVGYYDIVSETFYEPIGENPETDLTPSQSRSFAKGGGSKEIEVPDDVESPETWTPNTKVSVKEKE